jgi:ring-1,2-phenylacetyl-CoA epoxidase subunit PaaE
MAIQFSKLKVINVIKETFDTTSISFFIPDELKTTFDYKHGQYLTIKIDLNGESQRRAYSICTSPLEDKPITITVKKQEEGYVSAYLADKVNIGDFLDVIPPLGHFTIELNESNERNFVLFAGGSGVTPLMSILKTALIKEPKTIVHLVYANKTKDDIIFSNELNELKNKYNDRFNATHILTREENWDGLKNHLTIDGVKTLVKELLNDNLENSEYFMCGPSTMMKNVQEGLAELGINKSNIHKESFTAPKEENETNEENEMRPELTVRTIKLKLYGEIHEIQVQPDENITVAAMRKALDPPFSCQIGACSTCRSKVVSGRVMMDENEALTENEIKNGYVLACQAHPLSDDVYIDMDDN